MNRLALKTARSTDKPPHISVQRYFEISLLLMLGVSFLTLTWTGRLDAVSIVLFGVALGVKLWTYARGESGYRLGARTVNRLSIFYLFFFVLDFLFLAPGSELLNRMLSATIHLILFVTVVKIFSARRYRDYGYLAALSFLMMLVSAVLTVSPEYLLGLALYVLFAISMFIGYELKRGIETATHAPRGPYPSPARNRIAVENSLGMTALGLALGIAAGSSALFFLIPRYHAACFTNLALQTQNVTGFSESVNLEAIGAVKRSNLVVMRVRVGSDAREFQGVRWRGIALAGFSGKVWYNDDTAQVRLSPAWPGKFVLPWRAAQLSWPHRPVRYQVLLSSLSTDVLFAAAQPREIFGNFPSLGMDETGSLHDPSHSGVPVVYTVVSDLGRPPADALRRAGADYGPEIRLHYLSLPGPDPKLTALARSVAGSASNNYDRAVAIRNYLRRNFGYTLDPTGINPNDPVDSFLFKSRKGYCAYFAAAMTLMLRALNVPARIVNGFQTGTYNPIGRDFVVRARDAHSWVEVYFPGYGWFSFDPTPAGPGEGAAWSSFDDYLDAASLFWDEWIINYDFAHQVLLAREVDRNSRRYRLAARRRFDLLRDRAARWAFATGQGLVQHKLLAALALLVACLAGYVTLATKDGLRLRWQLRFGWRRKGLPPNQAARCYHQFLKITRSRGFQKSPAQTPREFARALTSSPLGPAADEFTRVYNALRFGGKPVPNTQMRALLDRLLKA